MDPDSQAEDPLSGLDFLASSSLEALDVPSAEDLFDPHEFDDLEQGPEEKPGDANGDVGTQVDGDDFPGASSTESDCVAPISGGGEEEEGEDGADDYPGSPSTSKVGFMQEFAVEGRRHGAGLQEESFASDGDPDDGVDAAASASGTSVSTSRTPSRTPLRPISSDIVTDADKTHGQLKIVKMRTFGDDDDANADADPVSTTTTTLNVPTTKPPMAPRASKKQLLPRRRRKPSRRQVQVQVQGKRRSIRSLGRLRLRARRRRTLASLSLSSEVTTRRSPSAGQKKQQQQRSKSTMLIGLYSYRHRHRHQHQHGHQKSVDGTTTTTTNSIGVKLPQLHKTNNGSCSTTNKTTTFPPRFRQRRIRRIKRSESSFDPRSSTTNHWMPYDALSDPHLQSYLTRPVVRHNLRSNHLIDDAGRLLRPSKGLGKHAAFIVEDFIHRLEKAAAGIRMERCRLDRTRRKKRRQEIEERKRRRRIAAWKKKLDERRDKMRRLREERLASLSSSRQIK